ncbi:MOSC domain-containing protein [Aggregicoccus sp. 17bor-14]|uniref:MOSC and FAD-binding oxidoreductase domain-containing protein n=1 Tax=Myxococcaceae TaxID=31 RepID=UPI00129C5B0E|nr:MULTISPECIES: MOSC and FAD-binding oxidoreductase domain-containing protein [Myxococcaceae]MBF5043773.1 MOSC domain-containing protein [Simulacricoccus sp. 17bor-14]MRI89527.1 MOSC domain-containing protein [Aggregicoccus sp. 17bor-14]
MARLHSVNVGLPRDVPWEGRTVHTGVWKAPVNGRRTVRRLNIEGDGQGDLGGHGGEHRAVLVYQLGSYRYWEQLLGRAPFTPGQFGENFTVEGLADDEVCIGDRYRIGTALFEVSQPRVTCFRLGLRMGEPRMAALVVAHHRPGFYLRVLEEGEVGAGDEIEQVAVGPERMSVAQVDALLYLPGHAREDLLRALRIGALSPGWRGSFQALLDAEASGATGGNTGLAPGSGPPPAWTGFRPLRIARIAQESHSISSFELEAEDGSALPAALPGQFVVLRLWPQPGAPPLLRSYSLSGEPGAPRYRVSVKREPHGAGSAFLFEHCGVGARLEVSAPRGAFTLRAGEGPVALLSAGVGATPVLAMLHALVQQRSPREVWWLFGARDRGDHPFVDEARRLVAALARGRAHVRYSRPGAQDRLGQDYDAAGRWTADAVQALGVPRAADFYLCGPPAFLEALGAGLAAWGVARERIHEEVFGAGASLTPGIAPTAARPVHAPVGPAGTGPTVSFTRSGLAVPWSPRFASLLELAEACDVPVRWSCRTGVCHTCESGLVSGAVSYAPEPLDPPAAGSVLPCCATPTADVVLDL